MNKNEFKQSIALVAEYYSKTLTDGLVAVYFDNVSDLPIEVFDLLLKKHIASEQGKFWPTFSHLLEQAGTESDEATRAGIEFDKNTGIDGTGHFDRNQETQFKTAERRKRYIKSQQLAWKKTTPAEKLATSILLPYVAQSLKGIES